MTFFSILETILIGPLKLIFEIVFDYANQFLEHPGAAIIYLSLIMNILVLPLYRRADAMQKETRDREAKIHDGVSHIKKTFSGDERMMILQTYYRQNHYKSTDVLKGSVSLLLEIPFFIAAYQFLSHLEVLRGISFGPIKDLGKSDGLLVLGGVTINLLPIIMTTVNVTASAIYLKGFPLKTKIQLYTIALFFLVFLYQSPSCLVFYWTLNNVFSLIKNIFYKLDNPQRLLRFIMYFAYYVILAFGTTIYYDGPFIKRVTLIVIGLFLPMLFVFIKKNVYFRENTSDNHFNHRIITLGTVFLTIFIGLLIPSVFIAASPQEYVNISSFHNPLWYIASSLCLAIGTFFVWMRVFYWLASPKGKVVLARIIWIMCGVVFVNYMFFGTHLGIISSVLQYKNGMSFSWLQQMINLLILLFVATVMYLFIHKWKRVATTVLAISILVLGTMASLNLVTIKKSIDELLLHKNEWEDISETPHFQLSKTGHNVIVLMLDRAVGEYIPFIFNEKPELLEQFSGFTYYENTISFGGHTNFAAPAMLGGYEYTPVEMNKRNTESLVSKHNEALKVMPVIFSENGYEVTVCDPVYANYQWIPDLRIYNDYPGVKTYITNGQFDDEGQTKVSIENDHRNFFCFSVMKSMPIFLQPTIYDGGRYHQITLDFAQTIQTRDSMSKSTGLDATFMGSYRVLENLPNMTKVTENEINTFLFLSNDMTHDPMLLEEPGYTPADNVDNTQYDVEHADRFVIDGRELKVQNYDQMIHYQTNMAALIQLGKWFDYLRENDIYDNTKIILVGDHGSPLGQSEELVLGNRRGNDVEFFYPLLLVKDFNSEKFVTSDTFMTNADVPTLAMKDLIQNPTNPFTGKVINSDEKYAHDQFIIISEDWDVNENNGNTYWPAKWASVRDNLWDENNWTFFDEEIVLDEHTAP